ncbi:MAG TPA: flagellar basal body P-ring formation chaperone FlgA [Rhizobacter sp.]|nr:flagellar basal body P-ring formation chaperone FlgA [Rhizobacter sp.]
MYKTLLSLHLLIAWLPLWLTSAAWAAPAAAATANLLSEPLAQEVRQLVAAHAALPSELRMELALGELDPRLRLAPCKQVQAFVPAGAKLWGKSRIGLRCVEGVTHWNVYLPLTVNVYGRALVAATPLPAGHVLAQADLREADVNLSEEPLQALAIPDLVLGRTLARPLAAGQSLRQGSLKVRQWFAAGDSVQIRAVGTGFAALGRGEALTAGMEGQTARVRTENGRVVSGMPVAQHELEIAL